MCAGVFGGPIDVPNVTVAVAVQNAVQRHHGLSSRHSIHAGRRREDHNVEPDGDAF